ncbi:MAG: hypothetical protein ACTS8S_17225, partial [Giesbergeria sp.]
VLLAVKRNAADRPRPRYHTPRGVMQDVPSAAKLVKAAFERPFTLRKIMHFSTRLISFAIAGLAVSAVCAQDLRAVAEDGRKVLLSPNGKWRFDTSVGQAVPAPRGGMLTYQPAVKKFSVAYNSNEWTLMPPKDGEESNRRTFGHKMLPIYSVVIADEIPASTASLKAVILSNARATGSEPTVLLDKQTDISGNAVGSIRFAVAPKGIEFVFSSYYFGGPDGNIQVTCYTAQSLYFKYKAECKKFMDGLAIK